MAPRGDRPASVRYDRGAPVTDVFIRYRDVTPSQLEREWEPFGQWLARNNISSEHSDCLLERLNARRFEPLTERLASTAMIDARWIWRDWIDRGVDLPELPPICFYESGAGRVVLCVKRERALDSQRWGVDDCFGAGDREYFSRHEDPSVRELYESYLALESKR